MAVEAVAAAGEGEAQKKNRIQVSNTQKPLFFYVNLAKVWVFLSEFLFLFDMFHAK